MLTKAKAYGIADGFTFSDYDVYAASDFKEGTIITNYGNGHTSFKIDIDQKTIAAMLDDTYIPAKGSTLYVAPECPIPSADIRKNYTIKRDPDAGDCNIFSKASLSGNWMYVVVIQSLHAFFMFNYWRNDGNQMNLLQQIWHESEIFQTVKPSDCWFGTDIFGVGVLPKAWLKLFKGELTKPAISYKKLDMNFGLELTDDMIDLVYRTGKVDCNYDKNTISKCCLELSALNQYNWQEYPRTMYMLTNTLKQSSNNTYKEICRTQSKQNKAVKQIINTNFDSKAVSLKDHEMAKRFMLRHLGLDDNTMYVSYDSIANKAREAGISIGLFLDVFDAVVRVKPKEYETIDNTV